MKYFNFFFIKTHTREGTEYAHSVYMFLYKKKPKAD